MSERSREEYRSYFLAYHDKVWYWSLRSRDPARVAQF